MEKREKIDFDRKHNTRQKRKTYSNQFSEIRKKIIKSNLSNQTNKHENKCDRLGVYKDSHQNHTKAQ